MSEFTDHPNVQKILEYRIPKRKIAEDIIEELSIGNDGLRIGDIIDPKIHLLWNPNNEVATLYHSGVLKIADAIGAEFEEPKVEKTGRAEVKVIQMIRFGKAGLFPGVGEASEFNTSEGSKKYLFNQAHIRAINKAVIRGIGLYAISAEEDEEQMKLFGAKMDVEISKSVQEIVEHKEKEMRKENEERDLRYKKEIDSKNKIIFELMKHISLPEDDEKYPGKRIKDIPDVEEIRNLQRHSDMVIKMAASYIYREKVKEEMAKKAPKEMKEPTGLMKKVMGGGKKENKEGEKENITSTKNEQAKKEVDVKEIETKKETKRKENVPKEIPVQEKKLNLGEEDLFDFAKYQKPKEKEEKKQQLELPKATDIDKSLMEELENLKAQKKPEE